MGRRVSQSSLEPVWRQTQDRSIGINFAFNKLSLQIEVFGSRASVTKLYDVKFTDEDIDNLSVAAADTVLTSIEKALAKEKGDVVRSPRLELMSNVPTASVSSERARDGRVSSALCAA